MSHEPLGLAAPHIQTSALLTALKRICYSDRNY